jgi:hypothetical protein
MCPDLWTIFDFIGWLRKNEQSFAIWLEGIALVAIFILELVEYRRQGRDKKEQHEEWVQQMTIIQRQANETARSAKAAQDGIELMMSKERARLRIEMENLDLTPTDGAHEVKFKVRISGPTPAFIVDTKCAAFILPKQFMADKETADRLMRPLYSFPSVIEPGRDVDAYAFMGFVVEDGMDLEIQAVKNGELFVGIRGIVTYTDVFERERSTSFRYFYDYSEIPGLADGWTKCGQPEENQAT